MVLALCLALERLGLTPYNYYEVIKNKEKGHFQLWLAAIDAKFYGIGVPFQKREFDTILKDYSVSRFSSISGILKTN